MASKAELEFLRAGGAAVTGCAISEIELLRNPSVESTSRGLEVAESNAAADKSTGAD
jgi:hypothetical protein